MSHPRTSVCAMSSALAPVPAGEEREGHGYLVTPEVLSAERMKPISDSASAKHSALLALTG